MFFNKVIRLLVIATAALSVTAEAQDTTMTVPATTTKIDTQEISESFEATRGVRISLVKSFVTANIVDETYNYSVEGIEQELGIGVGYVYIPILSLGFTGRVLYSQFTDTPKFHNVHSFRFEANATYGIYEGFYVLGGGHFNKFSADNVDSLKPTPGFQVGGGHQMNPRLGIEVTYILFNQKFKRDFVDYDYDMEGIEVSLNGTF